MPRVRNGNYICSTGPSITSSGIAQLGALHMWLQYRDHPAKALENYRRALALGGTRPLPDLFAAAGIPFDFSAKAVAPLIDAVRQELTALRLTNQ